MVLRYARWLRDKIRRLIRNSTRSRRSYRLPLEGLIFVGVTLLIGLAAVNTGAQLLYLVFGMMCAFWILSDVLASTSMRGLRVERVAPRLVVARQPVRVQLRVRNLKGFFSSYSLRLADLLAGDRPIGAGFVPRLRPGSEAEETYRCVFPRRGVYTFQSITIVTSFPFGLIQRTLTIKDAWEILVLPATIPVDRILRPVRAELGDYESQMKGRGVSLYGIREYYPGESARDIHWKLSARTDNLMVREYESEERRRATVVLDNRLPDVASFDDQENLEKGVVLANSVISFLIDHGHQVELLTASGKVALGGGPQHLLRCRRALASLGVERADASPPELHGVEEGAVKFFIQVRENAPTPANAFVLKVRDNNEDLAAAISDYGESSPATLKGIHQV